ncbi:M1 family metallopeptidase [Luteimonas sp. SJ-92]|uniref:Aminopeptidase N n=1 Tax=Luteimonas salinisoli TaxID=2752307 RepID=A0A853JEI6_9GAMM|nr:M1 family metallopeptidase [Luteimonas salinisoli]NZA27174.1 M1 family metallopeptidase [Luteimonas salinisoli]
MRVPPTRSGRLFPLAVLSLLALLAVGCQREPTPETSTPIASREAPVAAEDRDEHSYAEPDKVVIADLALDLDLDFETRTLAGTATYTLEWKDDGAGELVLDTRDLAIERVEGETDGAWQPLQHALDPADERFGSRLVISTPERNARVRVAYRTSPNASGLQWLEPSMTAGGELPFMFSQSQAIHARSWVPLQDSPSVRYTYGATVRSRPDVMVLMSADNDPDAVRDGEYRFSMPQKIPSYLMAIAAGDLVFKPISTRSGVWAEPATVDAAVEEFADTEEMIVTAERLYGPYRWERYDLLILPPSFPYGGMENPRLSFITPTVIVGDKSLVSLIAHELAHSWSGNLVTNASWKDMWLNEGFTSYVENRIVEALYGREVADMEYVIARDGLQKALADTPAQLQVLAVRPGDARDPDDTFGAVAYDKGAWFLQFLEERFGRDTLDAFLRGYFDAFAFQSISTATFVEHLEAELLPKKPDAVTKAEIEEWLYAPGIPASAPMALSPRLGLVDSARLAWLGSAQLPPQAMTADWTTQEWIHFLEGMPDTLTLEQMSQLDTAYGFTGTSNGELAMRWYPLAVRSGYAIAFEPMNEFLQRIGRRKLIMPVYEALATTEEGLALARSALRLARPGYHPITTASAEKALDEASPPPGSRVTPAAPAEPDIPETGADGRTGTDPDAPPAETPTPAG